MMKRLTTVKGSNSITAYYQVPGVNDDQTGAEWITAALRIPGFVPESVRLTYSGGEGGMQNPVADFRPQEVYGNKLGMEMRVLPVDTILVSGRYLSSRVIIGYRDNQNTVFVSVPKNTDLTLDSLNDLIRALGQISI